MQTVNFHCPHCGNLMAVSTNLLGRNVRCPHCKQVVRAPAAPGEPPAVTVPAAQAPPPQVRMPTPTEHHESIFGERHDEDLFGSEPLKPTMPTGAAAAPPTMPEAPPPPPEYAETQTYEAPAFGALDYSAQAPPAAERDRGRTEDEPPPVRGYRPRPARPESPGTPAFAWILLAYSAVVTVVAGVLAYQYFTSEPKGDHPFKAIPDFYGKYEKATGPENRKLLSYQGLPDPTLDVPTDLRVKLGEELTVGAIQVRPTAVTQRVVQINRENAVREDTVSDAGAGLILTLHVKNVSTDTTLHPDDPAFNRAFSRDQPLPYTALQIGRDFFYGPFAWPPDPDIKNVYVTGLKPTDDPLGPGEERDVAILVAPSGMRAADLGAATDALRLNREKKLDLPLLWRVQLRRGFVKAQAGGGRELDVSATTVIGVEFKIDQIKGLNPAG